MNLRPYQTRAVNFCIGRSRAFVIAPAGSGKTIIAAAALKQADMPGVERAHGWHKANGSRQCRDRVPKLSDGSNDDQ